MSDDAGQEPSMEEILASIRKIISEDGEEGEEGEKEVAEAEPEPEAVSEPEPEPKPVFEEDDALELTDEFEPEPVDEIVLVDEILEDEGLLSAATTDAGASAFAQLVGASDPNLMLGRADRTLEALVREVMRPLLSTWLEANLPDVVERLVQAEIRKMSNKSDR
tara:strand:- start:3217 stop:3708 length:492 start_codon:yes stop_codon:yes gene_type:complete